jgi:hypothetical protein
VSQGTLQEKLNQPYVAPELVYEKHEVQPKETAYIQKAAAASRHKDLSTHQVKTYVKKALGS